MKLLIVGTDFPPSSGGISTYAKEIASALAKTCQVTVLAPGAFKTVAFDQALPFRVIRTPPIPMLRTIAFFIYIPWIRKVLQAAKYQGDEAINAVELNLTPYLLCEMED